jgi:hypothetical protein
MIAIASINNNPANSGNSAIVPLAQNYASAAGPTLQLLT